MPDAMTVDVEVPGLIGMRTPFKSPALADRIGKAWSIIYTAWIRQRFVLFSRGGGDWPKLSQSTLRGRRGSRGANILRDTSLLFASLSGLAGQLFRVAWRPEGDSSRVGLTVKLESNRSYKNGPTLAEVAKFHQEGGGRLPKRIILAQVAFNQSTAFKLGGLGGVDVDETNLANDRSGYNAGQQMRDVAARYCLEAIVAGAERGRNLTTQ